MYQACSDNVDEIKYLLDIYKNSKYLKPRSKEYIIENIQRFYCCFVHDVLE
jgi:N-acetylglutamate synthase-like GNAT family acetyltransferase